MRRLEGLCKQLCDVSNQLSGLVSTVAEIREDITDIKTKVDRHDTLLIDLKTKVETNEKLVKTFAQNVCTICNKKFPAGRRGRSLLQDHLQRHKFNRYGHYSFFLSPI